MIALILLLLAQSTYAYSPAATAFVGRRGRATTYHLQAEHGTTASTVLEDSYIKCARCLSLLPPPPELLTLPPRANLPVQCPVCEHTWFQKVERLQTPNAGYELYPMDEVEKKRRLRNMKEGLSVYFKGDAKLYVGNLAYTTTGEDLFEAFEEKTGLEVGEAVVVTGDDGRSRGFAFVTMRTKEGGEKAIELLNGSQIGGRTVTVKEPQNK